MYILVILKYAERVAYSCYIILSLDQSKIIFFELPLVVRSLKTYRFEEKTV